MRDLAQGAGHHPRRRHLPDVVDYVKSPPSTAAIRAALKGMGMKPRALIRRKGTPYEELGLDDPELSDAALIAAMHDHPILFERPVVQTAKGTRLCRPPERLQEIL
jgi:arsenate reductase (glutaredoxin)